MRTSRPSRAQPSTLPRLLIHRRKRFFHRQLWRRLVTQRTKLSAPDTLDFRFVDLLLLGYVVSVLVLGPAVGFRYTEKHLSLSASVQ